MITGSIDFVVLLLNMTMLGAHSICLIFSCSVVLN